MSINQLNIGHLKKLIKERANNANKLRLWKVEVADSQKILKMNTEIDIKRELSGEELKPSTKFITVFLDEYKPPDDTIHVIVQPPAITGERQNIITKFVENNHVSLLRTPPSPGKTTLGQMLRDYFIEYNHIDIYISLAGISGKEQVDEKLFEEFWKNK
ncbi:3072_t:CDS:2, partial [Ambispora gerdemannii]